VCKCAHGHIPCMHTCMHVDIYPEMVCTYTQHTPYTHALSLSLARIHTHTHTHKHTHTHTHTHTHQTRAVVTLDPLFDFAPLVCESITCNNRVLLFMYTHITIGQLSGKSPTRIELVSKKECENGIMFQKSFVQIELFRTTE